MIITMFYISSIVTTKKMLIEYTEKKMRKKSSMSLKMKEGKSKAVKKGPRKGTRHTENNKMAVVVPSLSIIKLYENELNSPIIIHRVVDG